MDQVPAWGWIVFGVMVLVLLFVDLFAHRGERADTHRGAIIWSVVWVGAGLLFAGFVWAVGSGQDVQQYIAAYLIEKSLSVDNLFVFLVIFQSLNIPRENQRTVLSWGIFGALVFRALFIFIGAAALARWHWVVYVFGGILLYAAYKTFREDLTEKEENKAVKWLSRHIPVTPRMHGNHFFARDDGRLVATPLLVAVGGLELTDILFAIDSVPAAFAITRSEFLVYSSNAFAILGLRALYIVLAKYLSELHYLHYGLAAVLAFAAIKLIISEWVHIPALLSIGVIIVLIGSSIWASVRHRRNKAADQRQQEAPV